MEQQWKQSLYVYVDQVNKAKVEPKSSSQTVSVSVKDPRFLVEQGERSRRIAEWYTARGITPLRGETGVKTLRTVRQTPNEVVAEVTLHSALYYEKGGVNHREDRVELERLTFVRDGGVGKSLLLNEPFPKGIQFIELRRSYQAGCPNGGSFACSAAITAPSKPEYSW